MIRILRNILKIPINVLYGLIIFYNKLVKKIDPNSLENYLEELFQKKIDEKIGSDIKFKDNYFHDLSEYKSKFYNYNQPLKFYTPTKIASHRVSSLFLKEPYTIEWIEKNGGDNIPFIDIGANIGLYSIYYAHIFDAKVYSFEPSFRNLDLFVRNINLNKLNESITLIANPLSETSQIGFFNIKTNLAGLASAGFKNKDFLQKNSKFNFSTLSISADSFFSNTENFDKALIKIDIDGGEAYILKGTKNFLNKLKSVYLEIETRSSTKEEVKKILDNLKFKLVKEINFSSLSIEFWIKES